MKPVIILQVLMIVVITEITYAQTVPGDFESGKRKIRTVTEFGGNRKVITIYKRQRLKECSFLLLSNAVRIIMLRQPLISICTPRMNKGAYLHSLYMAHHNSGGHFGVNERGKKHHFTGENEILHGGYIITRSKNPRFILANIGYRVLNSCNFTSPALFIGWMFSKGHRENIVRRKYFFTGVGFCKKITVEKRFDMDGKLVERNRTSGVFGTQVFR